MCWFDLGTSVQLNLLIWGPIWLVYPLSNWICFLILSFCYVWMFGVSPKSVRLVGNLSFYQLLLAWLNSGFVSADLVMDLWFLRVRLAVFIVCIADLV